MLHALPDPILTHLLESTQSLKQCAVIGAVCRSLHKCTQDARKTIAARMLQRFWKTHQFSQLAQIFMKLELSNRMQTLDNEKALSLAINEHAKRLLARIGARILYQHGIPPRSTDGLLYAYMVRYKHEYTFQVLFTPSVRLMHRLSATATQVIQKIEMAIKTPGSDPRKAAKSICVYMENYDEFVAERKQKLDTRIAHALIGVYITGNNLDNPHDDPIWQTYREWVRRLRSQLSQELLAQVDAFVRRDYSW